MSVDYHASPCSNTPSTIRVQRVKDRGPLPVQPKPVCPGLLGGVLTPMAYASGRLFVPVVELCSQESAVTTKNAFARPPSQGKGTVYALDAATGKTVWQFQTGSGVNAQPVTFTQNGKQYVTILSGIGGLWWNAARQQLSNVPQGGSVWTFALID